MLCYKQLGAGLDTPRLTPQWKNVVSDYQQAGHLGGLFQRVSTCAAEPGKRLWMEAGK